MFVWQNTYPSFVVFPDAVLFALLVDLRDRLNNDQNIAIKIVKSYEELYK